MQLTPQPSVTVVAPSSDGSVGSASGTSLIIGLTAAAAVVVALLVLSRRYGDKIKRRTFGLGASGNSHGSEFVDQIGHDDDDDGAGPVLFTDPAGATPRPWDVRSIHDASFTPPRASSSSSSLVRTHDLDDVGKLKIESGYYTAQGAHARLAARQQRRRGSLDCAPSSGVGTTTDMDIPLAEMLMVKGVNDSSGNGNEERRSQSRLRERVDLAVGAVNGHNQSPQVLPLHRGSSRPLSQVRSLDDELEAASEVKAFLAQRDLEVFTDALIEFGVGSVDDLRDANLVSDSDLMKRMGMNKMHVRKFRQLLADSVAEAGKDLKDDDKDAVEASRVNPIGASGANANGLQVAQGFFTQALPTPAPPATVTVDATAAPPAAPASVDELSMRQAGGANGRSLRKFADGNTDGGNEGNSHNDTASRAGPATDEVAAATTQFPRKQTSPRQSLL